MESCRKLQLSNLLDLRSDDALRTVGLSLTDVRSDDLVMCQRVGEAAHYGGREGLLTPSAAVDGVVLALFTDRMEGGSSVVPKRVGDWEAPTDVPA